MRPDRDPIGRPKKEAPVRAVAEASIASTIFLVSIENGRVVLDPVGEDGLGDLGALSHVREIEDGYEFRSAEGLTFSTQVITQATGEKTVVLTGQRRQGPRRGRRQQHTILRIVASGEKKLGDESPVQVMRGAAEKQPRPSKAEDTLAPEIEDAQLKALAEELNGAADRMQHHLDRAIEAVRAALDPKREAATRRRYEAEFAGSGDLLLAGLA